MPAVPQPSAVRKFLQVTLVPFQADASITGSTAMSMGSPSAMAGSRTSLASADADVPEEDASVAALHLSASASATSAFTTVDGDAEEVEESLHRTELGHSVNSRGELLSSSSVSLVSAPTARSASSRGRDDVYAAESACAVVAAAKAHDVRAAGKASTALAADVDQNPPSKNVLRWLKRSGKRVVARHPAK